MQDLDAATEGLVPPFAVVDLDAFDANAADLHRRSGRLPIRVASKSVRVRGLLERVLTREGFAGVMGYSLREALWLVDHGHRDVFVAYPTVDRPAIELLSRSERAAAEVTLTIDSPEHVDLIASVADGHPVRVAVDVDASLRLGPTHLGVRRSPIREPEQAAAVARHATARGLRVVGVMFYDAQVAGLQDKPHYRVVKALSVRDLAERRGPVVEAVRREATLEFVNGGGTGSLEVTGADTALTELAAGSGLYGPGLFDGYRAFAPAHAAAYAIPVVRRPAPGIVTGFSGGFHASGPADTARLPRLVDRGLRLNGAEGAGDVKTPVVGRRARSMRLGDRIWLRHAKAGELMERFDEVHLVSAGRVVDTIPTYRGEGRNFG